VGILFSGELKSIGDMWTFYPVNLQHNYMEFEIRVGGEFSETIPPSLKEILEPSSLLSNKVHNLLIIHQMFFLLLL
jgi:hypothetical protein